MKTHSGGGAHGSKYTVPGYRGPLRRGHLPRRRRAGPHREIDLHQALHGAACAAQYRSGERQGPHRGCAAPERRGPHHHDHSAALCAGRGGGSAPAGGRDRPGPAGGLRGLPDPGGAGPERGRRRPHGAHALVRPRHSLRRGCGAGHPAGDPRARHHRRGGDHRRQRGGHAPIGLRGGGSPGHRRAEGTGQALHHRAQFKKSRRAGYAAAGRRPRPSAWRSRARRERPGHAPGGPERAAGEPAVRISDPRGAHPDARMAHSAGGRPLAGPVGAGHRAPGCGKHAPGAGPRPSEGGTG